MLRHHMQNAEKKIENNSVVRKGGLGRLALARWVGWSAGQVGRHVKS